MSLYLSLADPDEPVQRWVIVISAFLPGSPRWQVLQRVRRFSSWVNPPMPHQGHGDRRLLIGQSGRGDGVRRRRRAHADGSGTQLRQGRAGDDACDVSVVVAVGQSPGEVVQVGEVTAFRPQQYPHPAASAHDRVAAVSLDEPAAPPGRLAGYAICRRSLP